MITGAPCCGKTTLIDLLADKGFQTVPEVGRQYVEGELARGRALDEIIRATTAQVVSDMQQVESAPIFQAPVRFISSTVL